MSDRRLSDARPAPIGRALAAAAALSATAWGCSGSGPPGELEPLGVFAWSRESFDQGKFGSAIRGFQEFIIRDPLSPLVDSAQFLLGEAYLRDGQEFEAATTFERFAATRPNSPLADDAQFGACRAYWALSPKLALAQENTRLAIQQCQRLLDFFPGSPLRDDVVTLIEEASAKLAAKEYEIARYYAKRGMFEAANIYFEKAMVQVPAAADIVPEILAAYYRSLKRIGFAAEAEAVRTRLLQEFPESEEARALEAEDGVEVGG